MNHNEKGSEVVGVNDKLAATFHSASELCFDVQLQVVDEALLASNILAGWAICRHHQVSSNYHVVHVRSRCKGNLVALNIEDAVSLRALYVQALGSGFVFDGKGSHSSNRVRELFFWWAHALPGRSDRVLFTSVELPEGGEENETT